jgi:hypothetical protein
MADSIPPPPDGFSVDADPDAASSAPIPAPPDGYKLDDGEDHSASGTFGTLVKGIAAPLTNLAHTAQAVGESGLSSITGGAASLADAVTFSPPGTHSNWVYQPRSQPGQSEAAAAGKVASAVSDKYDQQFGTGPLAQTIKDYAPEAAGAVGTAIPLLDAGLPVLGAGARAVGSGAKALEAATNPYAATAAAPDAATANLAASGRQSMGAAQVNPSPFQLTGQETGRGSASFPQVKLAKNAGDVAPDEQATRAGIVKEVLNDAGEDAGIRTGVLTGNEQTLRSEYQAAKNPNQTPANALMAQQIGAEQRALPTFAQQRIDATGADPTLRNDYERGQTINGAFFGDAPNDTSSLKGFLGQQKSKIYQAALDKNGATQIPVDDTDALFADPQFQAGLKLMGHENVAAGASNLINLAKTVGFKDPVTGVQYAPGSVAAYNAVTKALNRGWTPDNAKTIGTINGAINGDIAKSGGGDLYQLGSKIHQLDMGLTSDSPGINKVFGAVDPNGVQTGKPFESIPSALNNMPLDQWRHIHDTLDTLSKGQIRGAPEGMDPVPPELQASATRAKAEMEGGLAREVYSAGAGNAGGWNANAANKTLNGSVGQKILDVAPPDEIRKFQTLNAAGQIMPGTHPYEGAGAQTARMGNEPGFVESYAPKVGAVLGAKAGAPLGPAAPAVMWAGEKAGSKLSGLTKARREANNAANVSATLRNNLNLAQSVDDVYGPATPRASGGKVDHDALVERLYQKWKSAKRDTDKSTKPLLNVPDASIIKALELAQNHV